MHLACRAFFLLVILFSRSAFASDNDTTQALQQSATTKYFTLNNFLQEDSILQVQNTLYRFENYLPKTAIGNPGLVTLQLNYLQNQIPLGFKFCENNFSDHFYSTDNLKLYNTRVPYTELLYVMGTKKEQFFKTTFSVNPKKNWNITGDFKRIRSKGLLNLAQSTNNNSFALSSNLKSKNNRYAVVLGGIYNSAKSVENGGVSGDSVFDNPETVDVELLSVKLNSANRAYVSKIVFLEQIINIGKKVVDTTSNLKIVQPGSRLILNSKYQDTYLKYIDGSDDILSGYYDNVYFDSTKTMDSTFFNSLENQLEWKRIDNGKHRGILDKIGVSFHARHQLGYTRQNRTDSTLYNIIAGGGIYNTYSENKLWWSMKAEYVLKGYNSGDYRGWTVIKKSLKDSSNFFSVKLLSDRRTPDYQYLKYRSNHFFWDNSFEKTTQTGMEASFVTNKYDFETAINYTNYGNILYFDNFAQARQFKGNVAVLTAHLKKDFHFLNWHLDNKVCYQYVPDSTVIRLPQFILEHSLYYQNDLLKGAAIVKIGVSAFYVSEYYANAYMPATGNFYLQDQRKYGNYPFLDFFISAKIQSAKLFFKVDHLNYGLTGNNYVLAPGYPYPVRTFKLGISWSFFD